MQCIGYLSPGSQMGSALIVEAFRQGLRDLGHIEGQNIAIQYRYAEGQDDRLPALAAELSRIGVDVIFAGSTPAAFAGKNATSTIPVVMAVSGDPVHIGLVASLDHPGGNVTGLTSSSPELSWRRLELLKEAFPTVSCVAVLWNPANPAKRPEFEKTQDAARKLGVRLQSLEVREATEFEHAFEAATGERADGLLTLGDELTFRCRARNVELAAKNRLPAMYRGREYVDVGGLMAYGVSRPELSRHAASYVGKILKGAQPADLPVEWPTKFEFVINLQTARAMGLVIPQSILSQATDEVSQ